MRSDNFIYPINKDFIYNNPEIFKILYEFNYLPAAYLHQTRRIKFFSGQIPEKVWLEPRVWPRLSTVILDELGIEKEPIRNLVNADSFHLLLPSNRFLRLAKHIGSIVLASCIRTSVARDEVLSWKKKLGSDVFDFVMSRSALFPSSITNLETLAINDVERIGCGVLLEVYQGLPENLLSRVMLKMPDQTEKIQIDHKVGRQLVQLVVFLLEREWVSLFQTDQAM